MFGQAFLLAGERLAQALPMKGENCAYDQIGVRDLVARGYFIPGGASQRGGGQAPMFPCRTLSDLDYPGLRSVTCDVSSRWVLTTVQ